MDPEREKRKKALKVWLIDAFMAITVVISVFVLTMLVLGYKFNQSGELERTGVVQLKSLPTGANVEIDGDKLNVLTNTNQTLTAGTHQIRLTHNGYSSWEKEVEVEAGKLLQLDYARLFKNQRVTEVVRSYNDLDFLVASPNREKLLYAEAQAKIWQVMSVKSDEITITKLVLDEMLDFEIGTIQVMEWDRTNTKVLARATEKNADKAHWLLVNLENASDSRDVTEDFQQDFRTVRMEEASDKLLALTKTDNLLELDLNQKDSQTLLEQVSSFNNSGVYVGYVTTVSGGSQGVGVYKVGEKSGALVQEVDMEKFNDVVIDGETADAQGVAMKVLVSNYRGQYYLTMTIGKELKVYQGDFTKINGRPKDLKVVREETLLAIPEDLGVNVSGEFIVATMGAKRAVYDIELEQFYQYEADGTNDCGVHVAEARTCWLDSHIIYTVNDKTLVARDYDGSNIRRLMQADRGYGAVITADNHWLYYVVKTDDKTRIQRDRL